MEQDRLAKAGKGVAQCSRPLPRRLLFCRRRAGLACGCVTDSLSESARSEHRNAQRCAHHGVREVNAGGGVGIDVWKAVDGARAQRGLSAEVRASCRRTCPCDACDSCATLLGVSRTGGWV